MINLLIIEGVRKPRILLFAGYFSALQCENNLQKKAD